jgi:hypothetical protein
MARYNMSTPETKKLTNITNLKRKIAIISAINFTTLAFDLALTYRVSRAQVNQPRNIDIYNNNTLQSMLNAIQPSCYALAAIGDSLYLTKNDGFVDTTNSDGTATDMNNDVSNFTDNWYWLLLHLTKSAVRVANLLNIKGNPVLIDNAIHNIKIPTFTKPPKTG